MATSSLLACGGVPGAPTREGSASNLPENRLKLLRWNEEALDNPRELLREFGSLGAAAEGEEAECVHGVSRPSEPAGEARQRRAGGCGWQKWREEVDSRRAQRERQVRAGRRPRGSGDVLGAGELLGPRFRVLGEGAREQEKELHPVGR